MLHLVGTAYQRPHARVSAELSSLRLACNQHHINALLSWVIAMVASLSIMLMSCSRVLMLVTCMIPAGTVCVNSTTYVASAAAGCTLLISAYNSTDYLGYCLPTDTASSAWTALHATVNKPAVNSGDMQLCSTWSVT